ncbi:MAG: hypothetical protein NTV30_04520 [Chloroflexi bacterium]|nr:hypothetical protein [Chloroflexota bacterium]
MFRYTSDLRKQLISQGWVDASKEELPIVEEIRKLLINSTGTSTIKKELEKK